MRQTNQLLDYIATQEDAVITYTSSDMKFSVHSDASHLRESKARIQADGHFFLSNEATITQNNGAILNITLIIKHVMTSLAEDELEALYIMACEAVYIKYSRRKWGTNSLQPHYKQTTPWKMQCAMEKYNHNKQKQWTCNYIGSET